MKRISSVCIAVLIAAGTALPAHAAPITTNTALPVAKGEKVFREQVIFNQSGDDPSVANRDHHVALSASVLGYGVTPDLALFGVLPVA